MYDCNRRLLWAAIGIFVGLSVVQGFLNGRQVTETESMFINPDGGACAYRTPLSEIPLLLCKGILILYVRPDVQVRGGL